jgi:ribosomal protein S4
MMDVADVLQMEYPGYLLNPGDMFSVEPERVLFATGMKKPIKQGGKSKKAATEGEETTETQDEANEEAEAKDSAAEVAEVDSATKELDAAATPEQAKKALRSLMDRAKRITSKIPADVLPASEAPKKPLEGEGAATSSNPQAQDPTKEDKFRIAKDALLLQQALQRARENPVDASKPYATPWRPRDYMSAFAFIPRYLEVNQNVCSAVYLRHPVARPGLAEVPTPISAESAGLAFNWYLRRR